MIPQEVADIADIISAAYETEGETTEEDYDYAVSVAYKIDNKLTLCKC